MYRYVYLHLDVVGIIFKGEPMITLLQNGAYLLNNTEIIEANNDAEVILKSREYLRPWKMPNRTPWPTTY